MINEADCHKGVTWSRWTSTGKGTFGAVWWYAKLFSSISPWLHSLQNLQVFDLLMWLPQSPASESSFCNMGNKPRPDPLKIVIQNTAQVCRAPWSRCWMVPSLVYFWLDFLIDLAKKSSLKPHCLPGPSIGNWSFAWLCSCYTVDLIKNGAHSDSSPEAFIVLHSVV